MACAPNPSLLLMCTLRNNSGDSNGWVPGIHMEIWVPFPAHSQDWKNLGDLSVVFLSVYLSFPNTCNWLKQHCSSILGLSHFWSEACLLLSPVSSQAILKNIFFYLCNQNYREQGTQKERESSICWWTPRMATRARAQTYTESGRVRKKGSRGSKRANPPSVSKWPTRSGPVQSPTSGTASCFPHEWWENTWTTCHCFAGWTNRESNLKRRSWAWMQHSYGMPAAQGVTALAVATMLALPPATLTWLSCLGFSGVELIYMYMNALSSSS